MSTRKSPCMIHKAEQNNKIYCRKTLHLSDNIVFLVSSLAAKLSALSFVSFLTLRRN